MFALGWRSAIAMTVVASALASSAIAVEYEPGVSVGQWVRFGEVVVIGIISDPGEVPKWIRTEVTAISGKKVTLRTFGEMMNGNATEEIVNVFDVEAGTMNGSLSPLNPVIAANLKEGDALPPFELKMKINKTEIRTYLGVARTVNVYDSVVATPEYRSNTKLVYDKASGILLELEMSAIWIAGESMVRYVATDTNIFKATPVGENVAYVCLATMIVALFVVRRAGTNTGRTSA